MQPDLANAGRQVRLTGVCKIPLPVATASQGAPSRLQRPGSSRRRHAIEQTGLAAASSIHTHADRCGAE